MSTREKVLQAFKQEFKAEPDFITRSPGRVNIIGEHTDYNDGFVLPMAIDFSTRVALRPRKDQRVKILALDKGETLDFSLNAIEKGRGGWKEYVTGVAWALQDAGNQLNGWEGVVSGDVPIGAGLSSSAALELALARAFVQTSGLEWNPTQMARICQKAENLWVGINSGIMDQLISACGKKDFALMIDCRSLEIQQVPLPKGTQFVILDTSTRRGLLDSAYNERRAQCDAVACHFNVEALRDINPEQLQERAGFLDLTLYRRAQHVISENQRVLNAEKALKKGNAAALGLLMNQSHTSLRDDYAVSREELDQMVAIAQGQPGCYGARMTGAGFGGCAVALVAEDQVKNFQIEVVKQYRAKTGLDPKVYISSAAGGTDIELLD